MAFLCSFRMGFSKQAKVLSEAEKKHTPKKERGLPGKSGTGSYPMPDRKHAINAKARAAQFATPSQEAKIDAKANKILHHGKK